MKKLLFIGSALLAAMSCVVASAAAPSGEQERGIADFPALSAANDWPWWRGPMRNGIASAAPLPTRWSATENVVWRTPIPGRGHSSPIVVGERVILTTADEQQQVQSVLAFDRRSGKPLWKTDVSRGGFPESIHPKNTHATPTVACDGERLFAAFFHDASVEATALSLDGKKLWQKIVGPFNPVAYPYGYAPSPLVYRGSVIFASEFDGASFLAAVDRATGTKLWSVPRANNISFSTPVVAHISGRDQLLISGFDQVASYDPHNGRPLWSAPGTTEATCGTAVWDGDIVVASGGYPKAETVAVRGDGSREVVWKNPQKCYEQSLLTLDGYVYALTGNGVAFCWRIADGQEMWKRRLKGPVSASPVLAGGHIYWANEGGTTYVFRPNPEKFELVAENQLGDDAFPSPAISAGQMFLRVASHETGTRQEYLVCIGR